MARVKIQLADNIKRVVYVETSATIGAEIGVDLKYGGVVQTLAQLRTLFGSSGADTTASSHRLLLGLTVGDDHPQYTRRDILEADGDLYTRAGGLVVRKPIGSTDAVLTTVTGAPTWRAPAAVTKTDDTNVTLTLGGTPASAVLKSLSLTLGWTGTLAATRGGTSFGSYVAGNLLYANSTTTLAKLAIGTAGDILRVSGGAPAWQAPANLGANPSATIGLAAVNGSASTFIRSDGAPALSQAIAPTWTGAHKWTGDVVRSVAAAGVSVGKVTATTIPLVSWVDTSAAVDNQAWEMYANAGVMNLQAINNATSAARNALSFARSGIAITTMTYGNPTDNPRHIFPVSGNPISVAGVAGQNAAIELGGNGNAYGSASLFIGQGGDSQGYVYQRANERLNFATNSAVRMVLSSDGVLGVNNDPQGAGFGGVLSARFQPTGKNEGIELVSATGVSTVQTFNRSASAYDAMQLNGLNIRLLTSGTEVLRFTGASVSAATGGIIPAYTRAPIASQTLFTVDRYIPVDIPGVGTRYIPIGFGS